MAAALPALTLGLLAVVALVDAAWLWVAPPFSVDYGDVGSVGLAALLLFAIAGACRVIAIRREDDEAATRLRCFAQATALLSLTAGVLALISTANLVFNYLTMTTALPLRDAAYAALDTALGFDWLAMMSWMEQRPLLAEMLVWAYASSMLQMALVVAVYSARRRADRLAEFTALYALGGFVVSVTAALLPALGAYAYHAPEPELFDQYTALGRVHLGTLEALRAGTFERLHFGNTVGMVSFPSFHTVLAVLVTYAFRDDRLFFVPIALLNSAVIASTLPEGGHYLIDIVGGLVVASGSILAVRSLTRAKRNEGPNGLEASPVA